MFRLPKTFLYIEKGACGKESLRVEERGVVRTESWLGRRYDLVGRDWIENGKPIQSGSIEAESISFRTPILELSLVSSS